MFASRRVSLAYVHRVQGSGGVKYPAALTDQGQRSLGRFLFSDPYSSAAHAEAEESRLVYSGCIELVQDDIR
jgi:hypothetical protein